MTQLELNSSVATILSRVESELRALLFESARDLGGEITVPLEDGLQGHVNATVGSVTIGDQPVGNVVHLLSLIVAVEKHAADAQSPPPVVLALIGEPAAEPEAEG